MHLKVLIEFSEDKHLDPLLKLNWRRTLLLYPLVLKSIEMVSKLKKDSHLCA